MATNNKKSLLLAIILFGFASFLPAQTPGYFVEEDGDEIKVFQRFVWSGGEYALNYEVVFEREINGTYRTHLREFTSSQFMEVSLPPGAYRYRVIPYDILGRPAEGSKWVYIEILPISQKEEYKEPEPEWDSEIVIEQESKQEFIRITEPEPEDEPEEEEEQQPAQSDSLGQTLVSIKVFLGTRLPVYGDDFGVYNFPVTAGLRASLVYNTPLNIYTGIELAGEWSLCGMVEEWDMSVITLGLNFLAIKWFPNEKFAAGLRLGASYPFLFPHGNLSGAPHYYLNEVSVNTPFSNYYDEESGHVFSVERIIPNIGAIFYWRISNHILFEAGLDFMFIFYDVFRGYIRPTVGIGCQY